MTKKKWIAVAMLVAVATFAGCASQKVPATEALNSAETALGAIKADAAKYVPNDLKAVESTLASLKDNLTKGDYKSVLAGAPELTSKISALGQAAAAKKAEIAAAIQAATEQWQGLSTDLPQMVEAIQSRVDILSQSKKLPKNMDQVTFDSAKSGLEMMKATWAEATNAFTAGNVQDAVAKGHEVKEKGTEVMNLLGLSAG